MSSIKSEGPDSKAGFGAVRRHVRSVLSGAAGTGVLALAFLGGAAPAAAAPQEEAQAEQAAQDQSADAGASLTLEEVVVTAQFRAEKLQETPLAITALSADALRERNIEDLSQIQNAAPNVSLDLASSAFGPNVNAFIRGIGQADFNFNFEPGVGIYVDDVYHATVAGSLFDLFDLERVEVLRGPQGTLFGKNSIGGAIRLISAKPKGDGRAYLEGTFGAYSRKDIRGMFDISLVPDSLFMRVSVMSKSREGYVTRLDYACVNPDLGAGAGFPVNLDAPELIRPHDLSTGNCSLGTEGGEDTQGARVALRWLASDKLEVNWSADFTDDNSEAAPTTLLATDAPVNPGNPDGTPAREVMNQFFLQKFGVAFDDRFITGDPFTNYSTFVDLLRNQAYPPVARYQSYGTSLTFDWDPVDWMHVKSITGYRGYSGDWSDDQEASPLPLAGVHQVVDHYQFSQELQFTGNAFGDRLDWATGVFYFDGFSRNRGHININIIPGIVVGDEVLGFDFPQDDPSNVKDKAAFLQTTYHITDQLGLTTGVRYSEEDKDYTFFHVSPPFLNLNNVKGQSGYERWDYRVGLDYQWTPELLTYAQVSTGFKGGGLNPRPFGDSQVIPFGPETLTSYEIGVKSEWFDRKLRANAALFFMSYKDLQLNSATSDATGAPFVGPTNVGEEEIKGFELELLARPINGLTLDAAVGFTDAEYVDLGNAIGCTAPGIVPNPILDADGNPTGLFSNCVTNNPLLSDTPGGPKWRGNAGVQYTFNLGNGSSITPRLDAAFRTKVPSENNSNDFFDDDNIAGYTLFNGRITWTSSDDTWSVSAIGTNLTDKRYWVNFFNLRNLDEFHMVGQPGRPREWAVQVRRNF